MRARFERFMYGRYGQDDLSRFVSIFALVLWGVSLFTGWTLLYSLALALLVVGVFRTFSRNIEKRRQENLWFLGVKGRVSRFVVQSKTRVAQRKTHRYYKCPSCKQLLRVPKGKGSISINCPKCHTTFERKS
ncbi:Zn-finger containing protein [Clostridia bacterium]|nr:Zn-finger containing protein [Clostridia bacterium]